VFLLQGSEMVKVDVGMLKKEDGKEK